MGYWRRHAPHPQPPSMAVAFAGLQGGRPHSCSGQPVPEHGNAAFPAVRVKPPECPPAAVYFQASQRSQLHAAPSPPLHRATAQTRKHPPSSARPPPNAARPGPPRLWAPSGRGLAAVSAARPRRHSPPRRALRRRPAPAPARPPRAPGRRLREAARPRALRAGTGGPGGRSRPLSATWQRPAGPRCCGSTGPCCGRASASADTTTGARPCDPGGGNQRGGEEEEEEEGAARRCAHVLSLGGLEEARGGCPVPGGGGRLQELLPRRVLPWAGCSPARAGLAA